MKLPRDVSGRQLGRALGKLGYTFTRPKGSHMPHTHTLTIKLKAEQAAWLKKQAAALKRSKGGIVRDLIDQRQAGRNGSLGQALADLRGCLRGSKDLSTRPLKGYGRR